MPAQRFSCPPSRAWKMTRQYAAAFCLSSTRGFANSGKEKDDLDFRLVTKLGPGF
jgi:hypothetical protein